MIDEEWVGKLFVVSLSNALKEHSGVDEGMMDSGVMEIATNMSRREPKTRKVRQGDQNPGIAGTGRVLLIGLKVLGVKHHPKLSVKIQSRVNS
jgi:hypothetical protein